jgi:cellulose synthase/poly-beta-1,6-N-acetylglucosamine synthase-like glycosyltransferase
MDDIFTPLFIASLVLYAVEMIWLRVGIHRADRSPVVQDYQPAVTVIVAARNEEETIGGCIESLSRLDYPADKLEIIIVNDRSTDGTLAAITRSAPACPGLKAISSSAGSGEMRGKTNALAQGIDIASGEILAFTDADCRVPPGWIRSIVSHFDSSTGIVGGYTLLRGGSIFNGMQGLDWLFLCSVAAGTAGWRIPLTAIGNNLSVRRSAYDATGGFRAIPFSVTEDYALVQAILTRTEYRLRFPMDPAMTVESNPCPTVRSLLRQKQRWGVGGLDMVFRGFVIMGIGWLSKVAILAGIFIAGAPLVLGGFLTKTMIDGWVLLRPLRRLGAISRIRYLLAFELYFLLYVPIIPFAALLSKGRVVWKGRAIQK